MTRHAFQPRAFVLTAVAVLAGALAGCGGGDALPPGATPLTPAPDTTAPSLTITSAAAGSTATGPVTFEFTFSENVGTSFDADDVVVTGGSAGAFTRVSGTRATLVVQPNAASAGSIGVSVAAGRYSDLAGNANTSAAAASQAYDTVVVAAGSGSTGGCTTSPCVNFGAAGYGLVAFGGLGASIAADPGDAANQVLKMVKPASAETWAGVTLDPSGTGAATVPAFGFGTSKLVTLRFLSPAAGQTVMLKVESAADNTVFVEAQAKTTKANQWETLTFDFGAPTNGTYAAGKTYDRVSVFPFFGSKTTADVAYHADELKYTTVANAGTSGCGTTAPTCAPTTAIPAGATVIYSDAAQVAGFNPKPDWGQSPPVTYAEETIAGNKSLKYVFTAPALYEGLDWAANPVDVSGKSKLHLDLWSADIKSVKVSIISAGKENAVTQAVTAGSWNSVDIDLAQFTVPDKAAIIQIKLEPSTGGTLYVDNIHFWGTAASASGCGTTAPTCAPTTTIPAGATVIYSDAAQVAGFNPKPDWGQSPAVTYSEETIAGNKSLKYGFTAPALYEGLDWAANPVNVSGKSKLHLDLWSADIASVKVSIISAGKENAVTQALTARSWNGVDIDLAQYTAPDKSAIIQIKLEPSTGGTLYVDNIHFWGTAAASGSGSTGPVAFSTGFGAGNLTVEGGKFGSYSGSSLDNWNCSGDAAWCGSGGAFVPQVAAAASAYYAYYQTPSAVTGLYSGVFIQAPGLTTGLSPTADTAGVSIAGKTNVKFTLSQNAEWFASPTNNFGVILTLGKFYDVDASAAVAPCNIKLLAVVTPTAAAATSYTVPLSSFGVIQSCGVANLDVAGALALSPLSQVDFQAVGSSNPLPPVNGKLVGANMSVGAGSPAVYPTTIALAGGVTFD